MGAPYHADLHIPAGTAADPARPDGTMSGPGTALVEAGPQTRIKVTHLMISTDAAARIVVGTADLDGQRIRAGSFAGNGGAAPTCCWEGPAGGVIAIWRNAAGAAVDISIDFELVPL